MLGGKIKDFLSSPWVTTQGWISGQRVRVLSGCTMVFLFSYSLPNRFHFFPPALLSMTAVDEALPFSLESVWVYLSAYVMIYLTFLLSPEVERANRLVWSFLTLTLLGSLVFWIFPTTYPRADFPIPPGAAGWSVEVFRHMRGLDEPANCLPSLHVGISFLCSFVFLPDRRRLFLTWFAWAVAIWISTMTTKQHYFVDGALGLVLAWLVHRLWQKRWS